MMIVNRQTHKILRGAVSPAALAFSLAVMTLCCPAQTTSATQTTMAALHDSATDDARHPAATANPATAGTSARPATSTPASPSPEPDISPAVARQLAAMQAEIDELKAELHHRDAANAEAVPGAALPPNTAASVASGGPSAPAPVAASNLIPALKPPSSTLSAPPGLSLTPTAAAATAPAPATPAIAPVQAESTPTTPGKKPKIDPFSDWDWTWLNGNPRNKDAAFDSKFFTADIRADVTYTYDFNKPVDNSMGGSSELFRSNEIQLEQLGVGGDFHWENVRARLMTQFGMYSTATVRNDPSYAKGQWNIADADRYLAEAYGGYHVNALNGINIDAGIFMSYIGLFSYYNFDNWAYQPSYVSSNTPWFFEGLRIQIFPNPHLKIEPWIINGWQSYGSSNSRKGLGGQIKWTPKPWINVVSNNYGLGHDDLYVPNRGRIHTDNSVEIKYYDHPARTFDKMAFTFTGDMGCEFGPSQTTSSGTYLQGVGCHGDTKDPKSLGGDYFKAGINPKQSFIGYMLYNRTWFKKDRFAFTIGGGQINNPGRYLVLLPPINGETASSAAIDAPYFTGNPSDPFKAWDSSFTFDYMPRQWLTFRWEYDYRHASVPYWSGAGGVTPPGSGGVPYTNNGYPQFFACNDGNSSMQESLNAAQTACASQGSSVWFPDLRRDEQLIDLDIMVKF
jgi:Putative beta-barrel porin-2, OmpL-like. bbp2